MSNHTKVKAPQNKILKMALKSMTLAFREKLVNSCPSREFYLHTYAHRQIKYQTIDTIG
jgi:hypothetical protein